MVASQEGLKQIAWLESPFPLLTKLAVSCTADGTKVYWRPMKPEILQNYLKNM